MSLATHNTVAELFAEQSARSPHAIALSFRGQCVSYAELDARGNQLAHYLRERGVGPEVMVACELERSIEMVVAFLGVLKAGGAYVPLDPSYPKARLEFILSDTNAAIVLTEQGLGEHRDALAKFPTTGFDNGAGPRSLAYVMYTSGSTGVPKGVLVENRSIARLVRDANYCRFASDEVFLQFSPVSFDASTFEIWGALLNGARLEIMEPGNASLDQLGRAIRERGVTTLWLTAGLFHLMADQRPGDLRPLRQLLAGGDVLPAPDVRKVLAEAPGITLVNGYGPTENTTFTCCHVMHAGEPVPDSVPIGRPISGTEVYILDDTLRPVEPGVAGELCAGGDGVARGYLNDPQRTEEKFVRDPFSCRPDARLYRTGDRVRQREDGVIEFLGRLDGQVKVNGFRIEPGEIEKILLQHPAVRQAAVVARGEGPGEKRLIAYIVPGGDAASPGVLRDYLQGRLPHYMIPSSFVTLAMLPLTPNGKVDRDELPTLEPAAAGSDPALSGAIEEQIAGVWRRLLRAQSIGRDDNFFDVGGDSLLLIAVHSELQRRFRADLSITDLFEYSTIRTLAEYCALKTGSQVFDAAEERMQKQREALARRREARMETPV